ncbi:MAG: tetratricopeptide repeat protein, partial [Bacteroidota bacterium]
DLDIGVLHFNLAQSYVKAGAFARAEQNADRAEELLRETAPEYLPNLMIIRGDLAHQAGQPAAALPFYERGLRLLGKTDEAASSEEYYPQPDSLAGFELIKAADILASRASVLATLGRNDDALRDYEMLFTVQDLLRGRVSSDESRRYLSRNLRPYFDRAIDLLVNRFAERQGDEEDLWHALELSERAKAYSLLSSLQRNRSSMPRQEAELRTRIAELERQSLTDPTQEPQLVAARLQLDRLIRLRQQEPELPDFSLDRRALASQLEDFGDGVLVFHLGEENGHLFLIRRLTDGTFTINRKGITELDEIASRTEAFRSAILASSYRRKSLRDAAEQEQLDQVFLTTGLRLTEQLFGEPEELPSGAITIIPDGPLNFLPFGCLPLRTTKPPVNYREVAYLQKDRQLTYAYSMAFLAAVSQPTKAEYSMDLLAFAPDFRGNNAPAVTSRAVAAGTNRIGERSLPGLSPLRYNQPEVNAIGELIPHGKTYLAAAATRQ